MKNVKDKQNYMFSYHTLRNIIGWIAILLPIILVAGNAIIFSADQMESAISQYYHTKMGDVLVGGICSIALLMFFYRGPKPIDNWMGNLAGVFACGVAWFPTSIGFGNEDWVSTVHFVSAALLFIVLSIFCLYLFRKSDVKIEKWSKKWQRNATYKTCGIIIILCMVAMLGYFAYRTPTRDPLPHFTFWGEWIALFAFGWAWIVKGQSLPLFRDKK